MRMVLAKLLTKLTIDSVVALGGLGPASQEVADAEKGKAVL